MPAARRPLLLWSLPSVMRGLALHLLIFDLKIATTRTSYYPPLELAATTRLGDDEKKCWIFAHLQKCGGTAVKKILFARFGHPEFTMYDSKEWKLGDTLIGESQKELSGGGEYHVVADGYTEALR